MITPTLRNVIDATNGAKRLECVKLASAFVLFAKRKQASRTPNASRRTSIRQKLDQHLCSNNRQNP